MVTPLLSPLTSTGTLLSVVVPFPSSPAPFCPQHLTAPPLVTAQVSSMPASMAAAGPKRTVMRVGEGVPTLGVGVHVGELGGAGVRVGIAGPLIATSTGTLLLVALPFPSWPDPLLPQQLIAPAVV